jgi:hypothetical protein
MARVDAFDSVAGYILARTIQMPARSLLGTPHLRSGKATMTAVEELEAARVRHKAASHGIGEPAVAIRPDHLLVNTTDPLKIHMRMDHLIELVRSTIEQ